MEETAEQIPDRMWLVDAGKARRQSAVRALKLALVLLRLGG